MSHGFLAIMRDGAAEIRVYGAPRPGRPALVRTAEDDGALLALMGRLAYRADALARLGRADAARLDDAALALALYRRAGVAGLESLEGDFALALIDTRKRALIALRDPMGGYPIYWTERAGLVAAATGLRPLMDLVPERTVDLGFLGEAQSIPFAEIDYFEGTPFEGARRLVAGCTLEAAPGRAAQARRYWHWLERAVDPGAADIAEAGRHFRGLLEAAVRERLVGTVAAQASGGMDSTAIAFLAADMRRAEGGVVHGICLVYDKLSGLDIERPFVEMALARPGLVPHRIPADDVLDYDVFKTAPLHDEPFSGLFRCGMDVAMTDVSEAAGADTVLTGFGADELLANAPFGIADALRAGRPLAAWREAAGWARAYNTSPWKFLRPFGLAPLVPAWLRSGIGAALRGGFAPWTRQNHYTIPPWVLPDFARRAGLRRRMLEQIRRGWRGHETIVGSEALARLTLTAGDWARQTILAPRGIHQSHPFRDPRVLAYALGTRLRLKPAPGRQQKPILAAALAGLLPREILERRSKGTFNSPYYLGVARNLPYLERMVSESRIDEMGLYDKTALIECLRDMALGVRGMDGAIGLNNTLGIVRWLTQLPAWFAASPVPSGVLTRPAA